LGVVMPVEAPRRQYHEASNGNDPHHSSQVGSVRLERQIAGPLSRDFFLKIPRLPR
jgi:hypothetical protein